MTSQISFVKAFAGGLGSSVAITIMYPFETARTRLQVDDHVEERVSLHIIWDIFKGEGFVALYRGWQSMVITLFFSNLVYFFFFHGLKVALDDHHYQQTALADLLVGGIAGVVTVLLTTPLWVANTRLKIEGVALKSESFRKQSMQSHDGMADCLLGILRREGVLSLWSGLMPSLLLVSNPALQFMLYETTKRLLSHDLQVSSIAALLYFLIGGACKAVATVCTYPLQLVQTKQRMGYDAEVASFPSLRETFSKVVRLHGASGLYRGIESKLVQTILTAAFMFLSYEEILLFLWPETLDR